MTRNVQSYAPRTGNGVGLFSYLWFRLLRIARCQDHLPQVRAGILPAI